MPLGLNQHTILRGGVIRTILIFLMATARFALAQDIAGNWMATPANSGALRHAERLVLKLTRDHQGVLSGTAFAGRFGEQFLRISSLSVSGSKVSFVLGTAGSSGARDQSSTGAVMLFNGTVSADGKSIVGWAQGPNFNERLKFERVGKAPVTKTAPVTAAVPAAGGAPAATVDSSALLARALEKLAGTKRQLLKYTCLETIERSYFSAPAAKSGTDVMNEAPPQSCNGRTFGHQLNLHAEDRLRLEVAVADGKEIDSWASASGFDSRSIHDVVSTGPTSTGAFGTALVDIFENPGAHYTFLSPRNEDGRLVYAYAFQVALDASNYRVQAGDGWRKTAYGGSFEIDPTTAELTHLVSETADLPAEAQACRYRTSTDYHYQPIGDGQYLIPLKSDFDVLLPNGNEDRSAIVFSGCHEYGAQSSLIVDAEAPLAAAQSTPKPAPPIPPGLSLTLALANPIDTRTAAAGDAITAKVAKAVHAPGSDDILVTAGAMAHGRILQMRQEFETGHFLIAIRYDTLEQNGTVAPFAVRLDRELKAEQAQSKGRLTSRGTEFALPAPAAEPGTWFTLLTEDGHASVAAGTETKWITVSQ
jgi:hypothetical protein